MRVGIDFLCKELEHHTYFVGLLKKNIVDILAIDDSCNIVTPFKIFDDNNVIYLNKYLKIFFFLKIFFSKKEIHITGIQNKYLLLLIFFSVFKNIHVHLHGQIYGIKRRPKLWHLLSLFLNFVLHVQFIQDYQKLKL